MDKIEPKNLTAQINYVARGNPPVTQPRSAIANSFPGLEFDFRNVWKRFLIGVEFHESTSRVISVEPDSEAAAAGVTTNHDLFSIGGSPIRLPVINSDGQTSNSTAFLEWTNALADIINGSDKKPECRFQIIGGQSVVVVRLELRPLFTDAAISTEAAEPGALTQSLCSPWQADFRECQCFYWAASRPDFVNVEINNGEAQGHNWMDRDRGNKEYLVDNTDDPRLFNYDDLYRDWEKVLRFQIEGKDEQP